MQHGAQGCDVVDADIFPDSAKGEDMMLSLAAEGKPVSLIDHNMSCRAAECHFHCMRMLFKDLLL